MSYTSPVPAETYLPAPTPETATSETYLMPTTPGQVRFWSLDQLNPGNPALNMPLMWQCTGPLNVAALERAFSACVERHEMLRTTFALVEGQLSQIIHPPSAVVLPVVETHHGPEAEALTRAHAAFRFNLTAGPLLLLKLLRFSATDHLLLVTMHHIICDGISLGILMRDMVAFYEAELARTAAALPELPIQFADFAVWQQQWLAGDEPARSLAFWRESLGNDFPQLNLPHDAQRNNQASPTTTGDIETLQIPPDLQVLAHSFCRRENVTLNILLSAVFATLLHRLTGQFDLVIGSPCANRTEDTAELIGLFMNIQVLRLRLDSSDTFRTLLARVQQWTLGAYENQELPFENLVHDPYFAGGTSSLELPIFFLYQKSFMQTYRIGSLEIVPLRSESPGAVFELFFAIVDRLEDGPRLQLEYNPRAFRPETIRRYLALYNILLASALAAPATPLAELPLVSQPARNELLALNETAQNFGPFEPIHQVFLRRAAAAPEAIALECNGLPWTNRQLAEYAQSLAAHLQSSGLTPGALVGICLDRSPEMLGAVLATLIAGAAYVPLDPRHPSERLQTILADSGATFLLVSQPFHLETAATILNLSTPPPAATPVPVENAAADLAYVIYTSGTTGKPKGVAIEHASLRNLLCSMQQTPGLTADDTLVAITTLAFDIAALELLLPLLTGAKLIIATVAQVHDGRELCTLLDHAAKTTAGTTVLQATPGAWRILLEAGWSATKSAYPFRALCGGEALPRDLADRLLASTAELWNVYGPTETTIWSSATRVLPGTGPLRLGPPIANTQFYVLTPQLQLQPPGFTGELYIGGAGLARGYWNRPELTAQKFIPNPFPHAPGSSRLYATGDLARRHDDGTLELLGRSDFQVKIRGYRIELAEIEDVLRRHPGVQDAVVIHKTSEVSGATSLTAYLAVGERPTADADWLIGEVRAETYLHLPEYMLPSAFVTLPALPRNTNGKIDRAALPNPIEDQPESNIRSTAAGSDEYFPPADVLESQLADIWQTTLGLNRISVRASFFSLGVGSLAALRLITKMNRVYAMDLGLASLISASSIESIAELIRQRFAPNTDSSVVPLQPAGSGNPLYIVHGVGGNIVNFYGLSMRMGRSHPIYGIQAQALVSRQPALLHLKDMAAHYIRDIQKVQPSGPYDLLGYSFGGTVVLEMAHQLRAAGQQVRMLGMIDSKSREYEQQLASLKPVTTRVNNRMERFSRNTGSLPLRQRVAYIADKLQTRAIRFSCMLAARLHLRQVPAFMRSAYDINYVAMQNYRPQPYDGRLTLFRASEQDEPNGPHDLGWGPIFTKGVEIHELTGDHERIFLEPNIDLLAQSLQKALNRA